MKNDQRDTLGLLPSFAAAVLDIFAKGIRNHRRWRMVHAELRYSGLGEYAAGRTPA